LADRFCLNRACPLYARIGQCDLLRDGLRHGGARLQLRLQHTPGCGGVGVLALLEIADAKQPQSTLIVRSKLHGLQQQIARAASMR
jgi:hypothetical protein